MYALNQFRGRRRIQLNSILFCAVLPAKRIVCIKPLPCVPAETRSVKMPEVWCIERRRNHISGLVLYELCSPVVFADPMGYLATVRPACDRDKLLRLGKPQGVADPACRVAELLLSHQVPPPYEDAS
jgi:hypothetical protein